MKKALCIGINYYNKSEKILNGCIIDVINMKNMLIDAYGYTTQNVTVLRDDISNNSNLLPTKQNILTNLQNLINDSSKCDEILLHYSGHGGMIQTTANTSDSIIVPMDHKVSGFIFDNDLHSIIIKAKCKFIIFMDSCNSGSVCELPYSFEYKNIGYYTKSINTDLIANSNIFMISGCKDTQVSADSYDYEYQEYGGVFTNALLHCLRNGNHNIDIMSLYRNICVYIASNNFKQIPILSCSGSIPNYKFTRHITPPVLITSAATNNLKKLLYI